MEALNHTVFLMINAGASPAPEILFFATFLAQWLIGGVPLLLAGLWLWGTRGDRAVVLVATTSIAFSLACNQLVRSLWPHPRPFMISLGHNFLSHRPEASFPSDHSTAFFVLGLCLMLTSLPRLGGIVVLLGIVVGWSRIYLGVHFPFDIFGSMLFAIPSSWLVLFVFTRWRLGERVLDFLERLYRLVFAMPITKGWVRP